MGLEGRWIDMFADVFGLCGVAPGDACTVAGLMHAPNCRRSWPAAFNAAVVYFLQRHFPVR